MKFRHAVPAALAVLLTVGLYAAEPKGLLKPDAVKALVTNAKTPADHLKLAAHYDAAAAKHEAEATEHEALAAHYAKHPQIAKTPMAPNTAEHCKYYAEHCRKAAKEMKAMADMHREMAKSAK